MSKDTSAIRGNSFPTNQTRARRSMDPPGHATDIVSRQVTKNRPKGPLISQVSEIGGERHWPEVGRPRGRPTWHWALSPPASTCHFPIGSRRWFEEDWLHSRGGSLL